MARARQGIIRRKLKIRNSKARYVVKYTYRKTYTSNNKTKKYSYKRSKRIYKKYSYRRKG